MFKRVLVPLDGSKLAEGVLDPACSLLDPESGRLVLLHVIPPFHGFAGPAAGFLAKERRHSRAYLARTAARTADRRGVGVDTRIESGLAARVIVDSARREKADLVAMSSHGRTGVREWIFGSVAERVLRTSKRPVLLFRRRPAGGSFSIRKILVPLDASAAAAGAVIPAVSETASTLGAEVVILHVGRMVPIPVDQADRSIGRAGVRHRTLIRQGDPARAILEAAADEDADIVAMGTVAGREGRGFLFGKVAESLLKGTDRPLLVFPAPR